MKRPVYLKDIAYEKLKDMIIRNEIKGPFISEKEIGLKLKMGRTPIREALQRLENDDFIEISPKRGIYIKEITVKETIDLMDVRLAVEIHTMDNISNYFTQEHLILLQEKVSEQLEMVEKGDVYGFIKTDLEYHVLILNVFSNDYFIKILNNITDRLFQHGMKIFTRKRSRMTESIEDHKLINNHLANNDFKKATEEMKRHIIKGKEMYLS